MRYLKSGIFLFIFLGTNGSIYSQTSEFLPLVIGCFENKIRIQPNKTIDTIYVEKEKFSYIFFINQITGGIHFKITTKESKQLLEGDLIFGMDLLSQYVYSVDPISSVVWVTVDPYLQPIPKGIWILKDSEGRILEYIEKNYKMKD
jgi:hypothetical protein